MNTPPRQASRSHHRRGARTPRARSEGRGPSRSSVRGRARGGTGRRSTGSCSRLAAQRARDGSQHARLPRAARRRASARARRGSSPTACRRALGERPGDVPAVSARGTRRRSRVRLDGTTGLRPFRTRARRARAQPSALRGTRCFRTPAGSTVVAARRAACRPGRSSPLPDGAEARRAAPPSSRRRARRTRAPHRRSRTRREPRRRASARSPLSPEHPSHYCTEFPFWGLLERVSLTPRRHGPPDRTSASAAAAHAPT